MRRNRQRGMSLVELLVSMAVMSILLVGVSSAFFNVTSRYQQWADRISTASTGGSLAVAIQADSHRYVPCGSYSHVQTLNLCPADDLSNWAVRYMVSGPFPYLITRQEAGKTPAFVARSVNPTMPDFWADCFDGGATVAGHIHVYHLRIDDGAGDPPGSIDSENFSVYYVAPWRPGCS